MYFSIFEAVKKLGLSTLIRVLIVLLLNKAFAFWYGANGVLVYSQVTSFISIILVFSTLGLGNGITKTMISFADDKLKGLNFLINVRNLFFVSIILLSTSFLFFSDSLSLFIFSNTEYSFLLKFTFIVGLSSIYSTFINSLINVELNFTLINKISNWYHFVLLLGAIIFLSIDFVYSVIWVFFSQTLNFFVSLFFLKNDSRLRYLLTNISLRVNINTIKLIFPFLVISIVSGIAVPFTSTVVRNVIISEGGQFGAGLWEALLRISGVCLAFFTAILSSYLVPTISYLKSKDNLAFLHSSMLQLSVLVLPIIAFVNIFTEEIILLLFNKEFLEIKRNIFIQSLGDFFKGLSLLFSYYMIAKKMVYRFIFLEIFSSTVYVILVKVFYLDFGFVGLSYAYLITYVVYLAIAYSSLFVISHE